MARLPFLARVYCQTYHELDRPWRSRALRLLFPLLRLLVRRSEGTFEYARLGTRRNIPFNARNLQFQALYAPFAAHGYETDVAALIDLLLPAQGGTFFDIGSNWGYFPLYAAAQRSQLSAHAFEPMPATYNDLVATVRRAGLEALVTCHHVALSDSDGETFMCLPDGLHSGQAMLSRSDGAARVAMRRLDGLGLAAPDFVKIDVEGHELEVLRGASETLRSARPFIVFENKPFGGRPEKTLAPLRYLDSLGYELFVPALERRPVDEPGYFLPVLGQPALPGDRFTLLPLEVSRRLFWPADLNILACHQSRREALVSAFRV